MHLTLYGYKGSYKVRPEHFIKAEVMSSEKTI